MWDTHLTLTLPRTVTHSHRWWWPAVQHNRPPYSRTRHYDFGSENILFENLQLSCHRGGVCSCQAVSCSSEVSMQNLPVRIQLRAPWHAANPDRNPRLKLHNAWICVTSDFRRNVHKWVLRSSGMLRCVNWYFVTEFSGQPIGPISKRLTLEDWTDNLSRNVGN
jgi:hypothetical protein